MRNITFNNYDIQSANIIVSTVEQLESTLRNLNIQGFASRDGGKLLSTEYEPKVIVIKGVIKGDDSADLDDRMDDFKKEMEEPTEADLVIDYKDSTRRFIATCQGVKFNREHYTITVIEFEATFVISDPPFGKEFTSTTVNNTGLTNDFSGVTTTGEHSGSISFSGTVVPRPIIKMTFNSVVGVNKVKVLVTNDDSFNTELKINRKFYNGDILEVDNEAGTIKVNGIDVEFEGGFPNWTLSSNVYTFKIIGDSYDVDVKFVYYKLWL